MMIRGIDMRKMCEQQGELSRIYMEQQNMKKELFKEKYKVFRCLECKKRRAIIGEILEEGIICNDCFCN